MAKVRETALGRQPVTSLGLAVLTCFFIIISFLIIGCASSPEMRSESTVVGTVEKSIEDQWGIKIEGIRRSAKGYMLDFRYRVIDPDKAAALTDPKVKPYLIDEASGAKFMVPAPGKIGPLRQAVKSGKPEAGKVYFILFANPGQFVKAGNKVSVVIGIFKAENLIVE